MHTVPPWLLSWLSTNPKVDGSIPWLLQSACQNILGQDAELPALHSSECVWMNAIEESGCMNVCATGWMRLVVTSAQHRRVYKCLYTCRRTRGLDRDIQVCVSVSQPPPPGLFSIDFIGISRGDYHLHSVCASDWNGLYVFKKLFSFVIELCSVPLVEEMCKCAQPCAGTCKLFRLYPTTSETSVLDSSWKICCFLYTYLKV